MPTGVPAVPLLLVLQLVLLLVLVEKQKNTVGFVIAFTAAITGLLNLKFVHFLRFPFPRWNCCRHCSRNSERAACFQETPFGTAGFKSAREGGLR